MPRLFVAIEISSEARDALARVCSGITAARWVKPAQMHLTLRFLGQIEDEAAAEVERRLTKLDAAAFDVEVAGVGVFPPHGPARVLWAAAQPVTPLRSLKNSLDAVIGPDPEARNDFHPHVTLARFKSRPGPDLRRFLDRHQDLRFDHFTVREVILFESQLGRDGAVHVPRLRVPLAIA